MWLITSHPTYSRNLLAAWGWGVREHVIWSRALVKSVLSCPVRAVWFDSFTPAAGMRVFIVEMDEVEYVIAD